MNKRDIENLRHKVAEKAAKSPVETPHECRCNSAPESDERLLARFYAARLTCVNTLTRMDGAERQMRVAFQEAYAAVKIFKEGIGKCQVKL